MEHDDHDNEDSELVEMGKRRVAKFRARMREVSIKRGDVTPERGPKKIDSRAARSQPGSKGKNQPEPGAKILKPRAVQRRSLTPKSGAPTLDLKSVEDPHLVRTRRVKLEPAPEADRVTTRDLRPKRPSPQRLKAMSVTTTQDDISRLYAEFIAAVRLCNRPLPRIDAKTFASRIQRQRELARKKHATQHLKMHVEVVDDRPVIFIRPR